MKDYNLNNKKGFVLKPKQEEVVDFLMNHDFCFNCSQTGLGKTFTTLTAAVHKIVERPQDNIVFIIVVPNSAVKAFTDTLGKILGIPYNLYSATGTKTSPNALFHIFNYSTLTKGLIGKKADPMKNSYFRKLVELKNSNPNLWLICDEAHVLQDPNTSQYQVIDNIKNLFIGRWFLTATPILNNIDGFFYMTNLVVPNFFGNIYRFKNKYTILQERVIRMYSPRMHQVISQRVLDVVGYKNLDDLQQRFNEIAIIRANDYNIKFFYKEVELSDSFKVFYKKAADGLFSGKVDTNTNKKNKESTAGARLHDLQRVVSNSHKEFRLNDLNVITDKENLLFDTIKEITTRNEATLIYFSYKETLERIKGILESNKASYNINSIYEISGDIPLQKRKLVESSLSPRDVVLITSAGTESINLQKSNNLIFYEIPFAIRQFIQACGRVAREGSSYTSMNIYVLEAKGTIDTYKKNRIVANSGIINSVLNGSNILPTDLLQVSLEDIQVMKNDLLWWK